MKNKAMLFQWVGIVGMLGALVFSGGCDQTADEYHQQQVNQQLSLLSSVSGTYNGTLVSSVDGSTLGALQIELSPSVTPVNSSDGTTTDGQASLQGTVTLIQGTTTSSVVIQTAYYFSQDNSTTGSFSGTIQVQTTDASGGTSNSQMTISGTISGNTFTGEIDTDTAVGFTGNFTAVKGAPLPSPGQLQKTAPAPVIAQTYAGTYTSSLCAGVNGAPAPATCTFDVMMTTQLMNQNPGVDFLNQLSYVKTVSIQLTFQQQNGSPFDGISFPSAQLDVKDGQITAQTNYSGEVNAIVALNCNASSANAAAQSQWTCTYESDFNGTTHTFVLSPQN